MISRIQLNKIPVGLRTLKTALAVTLALIVIEQYGASPAKVVFATIGAISAVAPTFRESVIACLTQFFGVAFGVLLSFFMMGLHIHRMVSVGVGIVIILTTYQYFRLKLVPVLPCLVLVNICLNPEIEAITYSTGRIWDTAIGLGIGIVINTLIFPYDNSRTIRQTMVGLDQDLILFLEDMFDGDEHLPDPKVLEKKIDTLESQLTLFSEQRLLRRKRQKRELQQLSTCENIAQDLLVELQTIRNMAERGQLNQVNRQALKSLGAEITPECETRPETEMDIVVNYHVSRILYLRQQLKTRLKERAHLEKRAKKP